MQPLRWPVSRRQLSKDVHTEKMGETTARTESAVLDQDPRVLALSDLPGSEPMRTKCARCARACVVNLLLILTYAPTYARGETTTPTTAVPSPTSGVSEFDPDCTEPFRKLGLSVEAMEVVEW